MLEIAKVVEYRAYCTKGTPSSDIVPVQLPFCVAVAVDEHGAMFRLDGLEPFDPSGWDCVDTCTAEEWAEFERKEAKKQAYIRALHSMDQPPKV